MAIALYDSDLTAANGGELTIANNSGNWDESSNAGYDDAGTMVDETNFYIQGSECISAQFTKTGVGTIINIQGTAFTVDTDGAVLVWHFWASPSSLGTYAAGGTQILIGNTLGDFYTYKASGSDFAPNPIGGWANYALDPASATILATVGAPSGVWTHVGMAVSATAQSRGNPNAVDAIRVGRCSLEVTLGDATAYGDFAGMSDFDISTDLRYALFQKVFGGFKWKGLMSLGTVATAVDFRAANANIFVDNTPLVSAAFNRIEVNNAASNVEWTSVSISAQDGVEDLIAATASRGDFEVVANATVAKNSCTFIDMGTFIYLSASTLTNTTYRRCNLITQGGATFTGCTFDTSNATTAIAVSSLDVLTGCTFNSVGTGHAVDLGTIAATASVIWGNTASGYAVANGATGNEVILVNVAAGQTLTINVSDGFVSPTYYNTGAGTVSVVAGQKTFTQTISPIPSPNYEYRLYTVTAEGDMAGAVEIVAEGEENATTGSHSYTHSETNQPIAVQVISNDYVERVYYDTLQAADKSVTINLEVEDND